MDRLANPGVSIWTYRRDCTQSRQTRFSTDNSRSSYLFGGIPPYIYQDIGGADRWIWFILANLLSSAAVCPFVGSLSDMLGRRYVAMMGAAFILLGMIVSSTAQSMNIFICKPLSPMQCHIKP